MITKKTKEKMNTRRKELKLVTSVLQDSMLVIIQYRY